MLTFHKYENAKNRSGSYLCIGLDSDPAKFPDSIDIEPYGMLKFNKAVIEATQDLCCAYKINFAFYEKFGAEGVEVLKKTFDLIPDDIPSIADAKRGDIGNTAKAYAYSVFEYFGADAVTVNPYMGMETAGPFYSFKDKMVIFLALTSNPGSADFQRLVDGQPVYKHVVKKAVNTFPASNTGFVAGATHSSELAEIREMAPDNMLLIPGIGTQGGDIEKTLSANRNGPAMINVSRAVIFPDSDEPFPYNIRKAAEKYSKLLGKV